MIAARRSRANRWTCHRREAGFTLTEAIVVTVIIGILAAIVGVFIQAPVKGYFVATRRAELADSADTASRRITRDLRLALPNSVRVTGGGRAVYLEFLITKASGQYRAEHDSAGHGDILEFGTAATPYRFDVIGSLPPLLLNADQIVIYNLGRGVAGADAYATAANNRRTVTAQTGATLTVSPAVAFPMESPAHRFHVVESAVTYACSPNAANPAAGEIRRYWGYAIGETQATPPAGGASAQLVRDVSRCAFSYDPNVANTHSGLIGLWLQLTQAAPTGPETVTLFQQVHVSNVP